jgi:hypothetical protein
LLHEESKRKSYGDNQREENRYFIFDFHMPKGSEPFLHVRKFLPGMR